MSIAVPSALLASLTLALGVGHAERHDHRPASPSIASALPGAPRYAAYPTRVATARLI